MYKNSFITNYLLMTTCKISQDTAGDQRMTELEPLTKGLWNKDLPRYCYTQSWMSLSGLNPGAITYPEEKMTLALG